MSLETFDYRIAKWPSDAPEISRVRKDVFIVEQQIPADLEWDGLDPACIHVLALTEKRDAVGTGRLEPTGKIGRVAVLSSLRGLGIGTAIMELLVEEARREGHADIYLHAQVSALEFYSGLGFRAHGERFVEAGIPHQKMRLESES